jgi:protein TonB
LVDLGRPEEPQARKIEIPPELKKPPQPARIDKPKMAPPMAKEVPAKTEDITPAAPEPVVKPSARPHDVKTSGPAEPKPLSTAKSDPRADGGAPQAGAAHLSNNGDAPVALGAGTASTGGGGTAAYGPGHGPGAPGLPAQSAPLRTGHEAKLVQTVRASYPPMALRRGIESDVTLRIIVDAEGIVTQAEVIKSGGPGFDEEALKAVKQSRFVPAQKDGQNVSAEFTFVYRFRLQR